MGGATTGGATMGGATTGGATASAQHIGKNPWLRKEKSVRHGNRRRRTRRYPLLRRAWLPPYPAEAAPS